MREQVEAACRSGGSRCYGTGVFPGVMSDVIPMALLAGCERVDRIRITEMLNYLEYYGADEARLSGIGESLESGLERARRVAAGTKDLVSAAILHLAERLGVQIDEIRTGLVAGGSSTATGGGREPDHRTGDRGRGASHHRGSCRREIGHRAAIRYPLRQYGRAGLAGTGGVAYRLLPDRDRGFTLHRLRPEPGGPPPELDPDKGFRPREPAARRLHHDDRAGDQRGAVPLHRRSPGSTVRWISTGVTICT